jgi:hypothetical protein
MWRNISFGASALALTITVFGCATSVDPPVGVGGEGGASSTSSATTTAASTGGGLPTSCTMAAECAALADACNQGACLNGMCAKLPDMAKENAACDDGLYCTEKDTCHAGACVGGLPRVCPGADACNVGACDEATKSCAAAPGNDGQGCPSDNVCKSNTTCNNGVCGGGSNKDCSIFDDLCTVGVCDPMLGCKPVTKSDGMPCDGGQSTTCYDSICTGGACQKVAKNDGASCDPGGFNPCSVGVCLGAVCQKQPANDGTLCDDGMFDPCTQGICSVGICKSGLGPDGTPCDDFLFCTVNDHCTLGVCGGDPNTCGPANGCFNFQCNEALQSCTSVAGNDGAACDDGNACTAGTTCAAGVCGAGAPTNEGGACIASSCTSGDICTAGVCGGGQGPVIYFQEDFKDNSKGWLLGPEWQIGPELISSSGTNGDDPPNDHTLSADNGVAGVVIGGNSSDVVHPYYYLESPAFSTAAAAGPVIVGFYRWLNSDYDPYMHNRVEVYNGSSWIVLWESGGSPGIADAPPDGTGWTYVSYDVTTYKNAGMKVRFGFDIGSAFVISQGSWNVDDVLVASAACP